MCEAHWLSLYKSLCGNSLDGDANYIESSSLMLCVLSAITDKTTPVNHFISTHGKSVPENTKVFPDLLNCEVAQSDQRKVCVVVEPYGTRLIDIHGVTVADHRQCILFCEISVFEERCASVIEAN